MRFYAQLKARR